MKKIKLSKGLFALVSDQDFRRLSKHKWSVSFGSRNGMKPYACRWETRNGKRRKVYMHREIKGFPPGLVVDHDDGDSLDNRRSNLKVKTQRKNMENAVGWRGNGKGGK